MGPRTYGFYKAQAVASITLDYPYTTGRCMQSFLLLAHSREWASHTILSLLTTVPAEFEGGAVERDYYISPTVPQALQPVS